MFDWLWNGIRDSLISILQGLVSFILNGTNSIGGIVVDGVGKSPQAFGGGEIYNFVVNLSQKAIVPIAGVIVAFVAVMELLDVLKRSDISSLSSSWYMGWFFKIILAVVLLANSFPVVNAIFELGVSVVSSALSGGATPVSADPAKAAADFVEPLKDVSLGDAALMTLIALIFSIASIGLWITAFFSVYSRMFEIYLMISIAPIPMSTLVAQGEFNLGGHFLKTVLALAFQAFFMILILSIYTMIISNWQFTVIDPEGGDIAWRGTKSLLELLGYTSALALMLRQTSVISKSVFAVS